ncbi:MAG: S8 family serine peptidase [Thermoplasmata archaeon]
MKIRKNHKMLIGFLVGLVVIGMVLPPGSTSISTEEENQSVEELSVLWFPYSGLEIDTRDPSALANAYADVETGDYYIIQYSGYLTVDKVERLKSLGVRLYEYTPYNGYIVGMEKSVVSRVGNLDFIRFLSPYYPAFKVSQDFVDSPDMKVKVQLYPDADFEENLRKIESLGTVYGASNRHHTVNVVIAGFLIDELVNIPDVRHIFKDLPIVVYNNRAALLEKNYEAQLSSVSGLYNPVSELPIRLTGEGEVIGFADTGFDIGLEGSGHYDFFKGPGPGCNRDRVLAIRARTGHYDDPNGHGTHTAGDALGNGYIKELVDAIYDPCDSDYTHGYAGVAPEAELSFDSCGLGAGLYVPVPDVWEAQYADGARQMSNSWGPATVDNSYGFTSPYVDAFMWSNPDALVVFGAGNEGPGWNTVSGGGNAHNALSVGGSENDRPFKGAGSDDPSQLASYSGRGPVENRLKPDIVGTSELAGPHSARAMYNEYSDITDYQYYNPKDSWANADYWYMGGTSASTPRLSGHSALTREFYREFYGLTTSEITSALVKATLINGATDMGYGYPSYDQGWGKVNIKNSLFPTPPRTNQWAMGNLSAGQVWNAATDGGMSLDIRSSRVPLKITMVHMAPMGIFLQDDLDLEAISPGGVVYKGNLFATSNTYPEYDNWSYPNPSAFDWDPDYSFAFDFDTDDDYNTVENIFVEEPEVGIWTVKLYGDTNAIHNPPFALIFSADVGPIRDYHVGLTTRNPVRYTVHPGGSAAFPFNVLNFGTQQDTIALSETANKPAQLVVEYKLNDGTTVTDVTLASNEDRDVTAILSALTGLSTGVYDFCIEGISQNDITDPIASDRLCLVIDVVQRRLARVIPVTNETDTIDHQSQTEPYVLAFNDGTMDHVFVAYAAEATQGTRVEVKHSTDGGITFGPSNRITWMPDNPTDIRMTYFNGSSTNWSYRVFITWHGNDPLIQEIDDWIYVAYSSPPYDTWYLRHVDTNSGPRYRNVKRMTFLLPLPNPPAPAPKDQLLIINEILEYTGTGQANPSQVSVLAFLSYDGGDTWTNKTPNAVISPQDGNYHFFPNGVVDQNGVAWILYYWRIAGSLITDRDLCFQYYDGLNFYPSVGTKQDIFDTVGDSLMFPAGVSTAEGPSGNRIYDVFTRSETSHTDKQMFVLYTDDMGQTWEPWDHVPPWTPYEPQVSPLGPYGGIVSQIYYVTRPILDIDDASNALVLTFLEEDIIPAFGAPNIDVVSSQDGFSSGVRSILTEDSYAKGQPITDTIGDKIFTAYHSMNQKGEMDIYLRIHNWNWENDPDNLGPVTTVVASNPNPINVTAYNQFLLTANIDDVSTGYNNISAAEYFLQESRPTSADYGTGTAMNPVDGAFDKPIEGVSAVVNVPGTWLVGQCRRAWVHGQDSLGLWGDPEFVEICLTAVGAQKPAMPIMTNARLAPALADVTIYWDASPDDGGGDMDVIRYAIYRSFDYLGPYQNVENVTATQSPSYTWTDLGMGHGNPSNVFYCVKSFDGVLESDCPDIAAKFTKPLTAGIHLISIPVNMLDNSVETVFQTIEISRVWTYIADDTSDHWKTWSSVKTYSDLPGIDNTMGLWLEVVSGGDLTVAGLVPRTVSISLTPGFNLIGVPTFLANDVASLASATGATRVEGFDGTAIPYYLKKLVLSDPITTGEAYWVLVDIPSAWDIDNRLP